MNTLIALLNILMNRVADVQHSKLVWNRSLYMELTSQYIAWHYTSIYVLQLHALFALALNVTTGLLQNWSTNTNAVMTVSMRIVVHECVCHTCWQNLGWCRRELPCSLCPIFLLKVIPTKICWLKFIGDFPMDMRTPPLKNKTLLESIQNLSTEIGRSPRTMTEMFEKAAALPF